MKGQIMIGDILPTDELLNEAIRLYGLYRNVELHRRLVELIKPEMPEINKRLRQENDVDYLAYAVEYALMKSSM